MVLFPECESAGQVSFRSLELIQNGLVSECANAVQAVPACLPPLRSLSGGKALTGVAANGSFAADNCSPPPRRAAQTTAEVRVT
jgi:hypothetical protein